MNAIQNRARLEELPAPSPIARPALPIRRAAAEAALRQGEGPVELTFDVVRVGGATEAMSMILERAELERTLESADGEELALVFNPEELERALEDPDVEAQGVRETAAVLTVALAAMAGSAGVASAAAGGASGSGYVVPAGSTVAIVNDAGAVGASGSGYVVPAGTNEAIVSDDGAVGASGSGYVIPAGTNEAIVSDDGAVGASGSGYVIPAGTNEAIVSDDGAVGASGTGYVIPAGSDEAIVNDAVSSAPAAGNDAFLSSTEAAEIGTGAILLVAGAAFAATRTKRRPDMGDVAPA
jgi:hypothetical protein